MTCSAVATVPVTVPPPDASAATRAARAESTEPEEAPATRATEAKPASVSAATPAVSHVAEETIRVPLARLEGLINASRRLTTLGLRAINLSEQVAELGRHLREEPRQAERGADSEHNREALAEGVEQLARAQDAFSRQLQLEAVDLSHVATELRLMPATELFEGARRAVRDLASELNRQIRLETEGDEAQLDKRAIDELRGPLLHLVRNCVDHGVETPEARAQAGKPSEGRVVLRARPAGDVVVIEIEDDGRGLDPENLRRAAVAKGVLGERAAAAMSDEEARYLIFGQGFSTAAMITEISGRGVGLDAVKTSVERLDGRIKVTSEPGAWTRISLEIPLVLAMTRVIVFAMGEQQFALPTGAVGRVMRLPREELVEVLGEPALLVDGVALPVVSSLADLGTPGQLPETCLLIHHMGQRVVLPIEEILFEDSLVVGPLGGFFGELPLVAGGAILGDGRVAILLKASGLIAGAGGRLRPTTTAAASAGTATGQVLIVDDSVSIRELMRSLLESQGYHVELAVDGLDGLQKARSGQHDLILTDVEMPNMNGFEFTRTMRDDPAFAGIPIVIVTTLMSPADRKRGLDAGANAYFEKGGFDESMFFETIARLIG